MTKRRPSWSDKWRQAAALICGLLLLNFSSAVWATSKQPLGKTPATEKAKKAKKALKSKQRPAPSSAALTAELGAAEMIDADTLGLHGSASFYGTGFQGRKTSNGERFDHKLFTAASNLFPLGTRVAVRRLDNDLCAIVKVNDRMAGHRRRILDVSRGVAEYLQMLRAGVVLVRAVPLKNGVIPRGMESCSDGTELPLECDSCSSVGLPAGRGRPPRLPDFGATSADSR